MPDLSENTSVLLNAVPKTPESYGPVYGLNQFSSNALDGVCLGAAGVEDTSQTTYLFAGTTDNLYLMTGNTPTWNSVTGPAVSTSTGENWRFAVYKNIVMATNYDNPVQSYTLGTSTQFAQLSTGAPQARHIAVIKDFVFLGNTTDPVGGTAPSRVWWSAIGDPTSWPVPGSDLSQQTQSDYTDLVGPEGGITGIVSSLNGCDGAIFFERGVKRVVYSGPPATFGFYPAENVRGTRYSNSIVQMAGTVYYLSDDGWYAFDGAQSTPIGLNKVDAWFRSNANLSKLGNVIGAADVNTKQIIWLFQSIYGTSGIPDRALFYRWDIQRWGYAQISAEWLNRSLSFGFTMEGLTSAGYSDLDTLPFTLDSPVWLGGQQLLSAINSNHALAFFTGNTLAATIGTSAAQMFPSKRAWVRSVRPLIDGAGATVALSGRNNLFDTETFGTAVAVDAMGECPQALDARFIRAQLQMPANNVWSHFRGVDVQATQAGWV